MDPSALLPLTVFDKLFERTTSVTGWLLEGYIDPAVLASALDRVTRKWRMLSGRLHSTMEADNTRWFLKIPLGPLPENYATYTLTSSASNVPLSKYARVPIPSVSDSLPLSVFMDPATPKQYADWESKNCPLTCWNIVYFPASANNGVAYTCIGFARCQGIFDAEGSALVLRALIAEIKGEEWAVPPLPNEGLNANPLEQVLANEVPTGGSSNLGYTPLGMTGLVKLVAWHKREKWLRGADRRVICMPPAVLDFLVEDVKRALRRENRPVENITMGDVIAAWIFKTNYSSGMNASALVHCTSLTSFRTLLASKTPSALEFPHNALAPLPYPVLTVSDLSALSLHDVANVFAASRASFSVDHVTAAYKALQTLSYPNPPEAQETLMLSDDSASRLLELNWSPLGSKKTLCGYRYQATPADVLLTNEVYISGRLEDGTLVIDATLTKARFELLSGEVQRHAARLARNQIYGKPAKGKPTKRR